MTAIPARGTPPEMEGRSLRRAASPWVLLAQAAGSPRTFPTKFARLFCVLAAYADRSVDARLERLVENGTVRQAPTRVQLVVGSIDMLRLWISPAAADYYRQQGIHYGFHQLLRFLDEPASMADPVGLFSTRDGIITHLMQVVHANPRYDLELLTMFDDGLDALESQLDAMLTGNHPRSTSIGAIVEEPGYHGRLREYVRAFRRDPETPPLLRDNVARSAKYRRLERTFGSLTNAMAYFCSLPADIPRAIMHVLRPSAVGFPEGPTKA